jgi:thymidylate synthase
MLIYQQALTHVLRRGLWKPNRTGIDTLSVFGYQMRFDLNEGFPLVTTKKVYFAGIVHELIWLISGDTNIRYLQENNVHIWDAWADSHGDLGPVYGQQWRFWKPPVEAGQIQSGWVDQIDQLRLAIDLIKHQPDSRRIIVTAWNPADIDKMNLPPCHLLYQFLVVDELLNTHMFMRSADIFLGVPFNIASYALLTLIVAQVCDLDPGELVISFTDLHLYRNHIQQAELQLAREPYPLPTVRLHPGITDIDDFRFEHISLLDYRYHPAITAEVAV